MAKCYVFLPPAGGSASLATIYANADGGVCSIPWSADNVSASLGGWETSSGTLSAGYSFTNFDAVINAQLGYGATSVVVVLQPISFAPANGYTPNYVFTAGYATSISSPTGQLFTSTSPSYPGAGTIPVNTCAQGVDNTAYPVTFQSPFVTAWVAAVKAALNHMKGASYASKIAYVRVGCSTGGQSNPVTVAALETQCSPQTFAALETAWLAYLATVQSGILSTSSGLTFDQGITGGLGSPPNSLPYSFADAMAAPAVTNGFGVGVQGLQNSDITAFVNHGTTSGGSHIQGYSSGDFCYVWSQPGAALYELQTVAASNPAYVGNPPVGTMGSLVALLPFAVQRGTTHLELYYSDWQVAYDPSNSYYALYGSAYRSAIQGVRIGTPTNPIGIVTGTFQRPDGTPVNGLAQFSLSGDGTALTTACYVPITVKFPVVAGTLSCSVVFNDQLIPTGSTYQITVKDGYGMGGQIWGGKYQLIGGTANLNTLVPM